MDSKYDSTISNSKEESLFLAMQILLEEQEQNKTKIVRPDISLKKTLLPHFAFLLGYLVLIFGAGVLIRSNEMPDVYLLLPVIIVLAIIAIRAKKITVDAIHIYQKCAPDRIRQACVFTPTCSEYMLLAIDKYGTVRGVIKGIGRLLRCHYPNSGEDYP